MIRTTLVALALGAAMVGGALAQTVIIQPEQETLIREYVTTHTVEPVDVTGIEVTVGATLPETVELHALEVPDVQYRYVVVDGRTVLVEPETRKIVHVIDK